MCKNAVARERAVGVRSTMAFLEESNSARQARVPPMGHTSARRIAVRQIASCSLDPHCTDKSSRRKDRSVPAALSSW